MTFSSVSDNSAIASLTRSCSTKSAKYSPVRFLNARESVEADTNICSARAVRLISPCRFCRIYCMICGM